MKVHLIRLAPTANRARQDLGVQRRAHARLEGRTKKPLQDTF